MFCSYLKMVILLDGAPEHLGSWSEGCACREQALRYEDTQFRRQAKMRRIMQHGAVDPKPRGGTGCKMAGKRFWELATGKVNRILANFMTFNLSTLMVEVRPLLTLQQWEVIATDFDAGRIHVEAQLRQKLHFWCKLPWLLCGLAAPDAATARGAAVQAVTDYTRHVDIGPDGHHRLTNKFLRVDGPLRQQLDRFIAGEDLSELADLLVEAGRLALIRIVERVIEARASHLRQALKRGNRKSGVRASLGLRLPEFHWHFRRQEYFEAFLGCWQRVRFARTMAMELGIEAHPEVQANMSRQARPRTAKLGEGGGGANLALAARSGLSLILLGGRFFGLLFKTKTEAAPGPVIKPTAGRTTLAWAPCGVI
jgi:hypothetical protein